MLPDSTKHIHDYLSTQLSTSNSKSKTKVFLTHEYGAFFKTITQSLFTDILKDIPKVGSGLHKFRYLHVLHVCSKESYAFRSFPLTSGPTSSLSLFPASKTLMTCYLIFVQLRPKRFITAHYTLIYCTINLINLYVML